MEITKTRRMPHKPLKRQSLCDTLPRGSNTEATRKSLGGSIVRNPPRTTLIPALAIVPAQRKQTDCQY